MSDSVGRVGNMAPIDINNQEISSVELNGNEINEITVDGDTVFSALGPLRTSPISNNAISMWNFSNTSTNNQLFDQVSNFDITLTNVSKTTDNIPGVGTITVGDFSGGGNGSNFGYGYLGNSPFNSDYSFGAVFKPLEDTTTGRLFSPRSSTEVDMGSFFDDTNGIRVHGDFNCGFCNIKAGSVVPNQWNTFAATITGNTVDVSVNGGSISTTNFPGQADTRSGNDIMVGGSLDIMLAYVEFVSDYEGNSFHQDVHNLI